METEELRQNRVGKSTVLTAFRCKNMPLPQLPRLSWSSSFLQLWFLILLLITGRNRFLNLYYCSFFYGVRQVVQREMAQLETFICYNDQPYDVAALCVALNNYSTCKTLVIQHGLILSPNFYFPVNAREFWAWGPLSKQNYRTYVPDGRFVVTGRYAEDAAHKAKQFKIVDSQGLRTIVIAPSHLHDEVYRLLRAVENTMGKFDQPTKFLLKLHPSTKNLKKINREIAKHHAWVQKTDQSITTLCQESDGLLTLNSTSAVDFLLRGKPVYFLNLDQSLGFPSLAYGGRVEDMENRLGKGFAQFQTKNEARLAFLKSALNV